MARVCNPKSRNATLTATHLSIAHTKGANLVATLTALEKKIETNIKKAWYENGLCMFEIQQRQLYKKRYKTFENYLEKRWNYDKSFGYRLVNSSVLYQELEHNFVAQNNEMGDKILPKNERQIRELLALDNLSEQVHVWNEITISNEKITGVVVKIAVDEFKLHPIEVVNIEPHTEYLSSDVLASIFTGNNEWYTPPHFIDSARKVMGSIDLDPASNDHAQETVQADIFYTIENSGLDQDWIGNIWMNPPYSAKEIRIFIDKLLSSNFDQAIVLTNNSADTSWFVDLATACDFMCFTSGRIKFYNKDGESSAPTNGQTFFYFGNNTKSFADEFKQYGLIMGVIK